MAPINLVKRIGVAQEAASSSGMSSVVYVGFGIAGLFALGVIGTMFFIWHRRKAPEESETGEGRGTRPRIFDGEGSFEGRI